MAESPENVAVTVEEVFDDFKGRRAGLIKALTTDLEEFYQACDPEKENLSLFGHPDGSWEVCVPVEEVPPELPEPILGINFARDGMRKNDWLSLVAIHCDSWLLSLAFFLGARYGFGIDERKMLFEMINELPTVFEVLTDSANEPTDQPGEDNSNTKTKPGPKAQAVYPLPTKVLRLADPREEGTGESEQGGRPCCGLKKFMVKIFY